MILSLRMSDLNCQWSTVAGLSDNINREHSSGEANSMAWGTRMDFSAADTCSWNLRACKYNGVTALYEPHSG